jgi:arabinose-5-phosphate isomerase
VPEGATIRDALVAITRCKAGAVAIVDGEGRLRGIFTDGDLRRLLTSGEPFTDHRIEDVMTRGPVTLHQDDLAVDILRRFEQHNINDLIVLDHDARVVGHVDIQDLPKFKIL